MAPDPLLAFRRLFLAAAVYNAAWGTAVCLFPLPFLRLGGLDARAAPLRRSA